MVFTPFGSSLPDYNIFRLDADLVDTSDDETVIVTWEIPASLLRYFVGQALLITDVNVWRSDDDEQWYAVVELANRIRRVNFCDEMIACLQTTDELKQLIRDIVGSDNGGHIGGAYGGGSDAALGTGEDNLLLGVPCDDAAIYGAVTEIVAYMSTIINDAVQVIENRTETIEEISSFIDAFPVLGDIASAVPTFIDQWIENITDGFVSNETTLVTDQYIDDLYEIACPNCSLTVADVNEYFSGRIGWVVAAGVTIVAVFDQIQLLPLEGEQVVHAAYATLSNAMQSGTKFFGMSGFRSFQYLAQRSLPKSPPYPCPNPPVGACYNYEGQTNDTTLQSSTMTYTADGLRNVPSPVGNEWRWSWRQKFPVSGFDRVSIQWNLTGAVQGNAPVIESLIRYRYTDGTDETHDIAWAPPFGMAMVSLYVVPMPDSARVLDDIEFRWIQSPFGSGNSGEFFTAEMCLLLTP